MWPQLITAAAVGAASPVAALVAIMLLSSRRAVINTAAYLAGWTIVLMALAALLLALLSGHHQASDSGAKGAVGLVAGLLLIGAALRTLIGGQHPLKRPAAGEQPHDPTPKWMARLDALTPWQALLVGMVAILVSPADVAAYLAALQALSGQHLGAGTDAIVVIVLLACISSCVLIPLGVYVAVPGRAARLLAAGKRWLLAKQRAVTGWSAAVFGVVLIVNGVVTLT